MSIIDHRAFLAPAPRKCTGCREGLELPFTFTMAFQPIVELSTHSTWGHEALVRGQDGAPAAAILAQVSDEVRYTFDQACRVRAIELAAAAQGHGSTGRLSINFQPNAVYEPNACIRATLAASVRSGFNSQRLMFEFTEDEPMRDVAHVSGIVAAYRQLGFMTAIDDFGAGYAGLTLLADLSPDLIKLDMALIRDIDNSATRRAIVGGIVHVAKELGIVCLAEGVETRAEVEAVQRLGIDLCQGFYFAHPQIGLNEVLFELI
jgi:EAL domain-containing protein (putative c-di-GMP-specific phosphodiesterase class I)